MKQVLDDLWNSYLIETPFKRNEKENNIIKNWKEKEKQLRSTLTIEQIKMFEDYDNAVSEIGIISEKNAFVKGVVFTTQFIFEALRND